MSKWTGNSPATDHWRYHCNCGLEWNAVKEHPALRRGWLVWSGGFHLPASDATDIAADGAAIGLCAPGQPLPPEAKWWIAIPDPPDLIIGSILNDFKGG